MTEQRFFPAAPRDEPSGDIGDQAQRLQMAEEQEAIAAALAGNPRGNDDDMGSRGGELDNLEGEDPASDPSESDSSDDPTYGGGLDTSRDHLHAARDMVDRTEVPFILDGIGDREVAEDDEEPDDQV